MPFKLNLYRAAGLLCLFFLQSSLILAWGDRARLMPQWLLLFIIIFALENRLSEIIWFGFLAGFLMELFSGWFFGSYIFTLVICGVVVYLVTRKLTPQKISAPLLIFLIAIATLIFPAAVYLYNLFFAGLGLGGAAWPAAGDFFTLSLFWTALSNLIMFYPLQFGAKILARLLPENKNARSI